MKLKHKTTIFKNQLKFHSSKMKRTKYAVLEEQQEQFVPMQKIPQNKLERTIEAQVQDGDTLQALALRFHCTVAEIKRLNKIDKDNEIYARKIIRVPMTPQSMLLDTAIDDELNCSSDGLSVNKIYEKLNVAAASSSKNSQNSSINNIILNSKLKHNNYTDDRGGGHTIGDLDDHFHSNLLDESIPQPRMIKGPSASDVFDCSGSDCDMSWICLFIFILALCFAIPLIYVFYIAEHLEKYHHNAL